MCWFSLNKWKRTIKKKRKEKDNIYPVYIRISKDM
jgi:hypothetical protein